MNAIKLHTLSGSPLKVIAVVSMVIDHCAYFLMKSDTMQYEVMRCVGRIAFPVFAFLIVEGFLHTRNRMRYLLTLLYFAVVSEVPWYLLNGNDGTHNVLFTLALGVTNLMFLDKLPKHNRTLSISVVLAMAYLAYYLGVDYDWRGMLMMAIFFILNGKDSSRFPFSRLLPLAFTFPLMMHYGIVGAMLACTVLFMYDGSRGFIQGFVAKYGFYAIYPVHLLLIWFVR
ncbi:hypothetical protein HMPREF1214_01914 [Bacteroides sp. HPS0048]|jgi:hypothetical protein|uniref:TraX family protein n=1 Tax=Bacteroides sp. HPS0048 TaxID=1078089 RepID=UPI0003819A12|nr:TraX family protein [Bacteroides sp. HPS0048]EOA58798.1 hypothetical protein HMPREF1214_01914 [Bacteroides sp. HPS0048]